LLRTTDGKLYGVTTTGGFYGRGTIISVNPSGGHTVLYSFHQSAVFPQKNLIEGSDGALYGSASSDNASGGVIYRFAPNTGDFSLTHTSQAAEQSAFYGPLTRGADGAFYGIQWSSVASLFRCTEKGVFTVLHTFNANDGFATGTDQLVATSDKHLYRVTTTGGPNSHGQIYKMSLAGDTKVIYSFNLTVGYNSSALTLGEDGSLWGVVGFGGGGKPGGIYNISNQGKNFHIVHSFSSGDGYPGSQPGGLTLGPDHRFYGGLQAGGSKGLGYIYAISPGGAFNIIHSVLKAPDSPIVNGMTVGVDGALYGIDAGGSNGVGITVRLTTDGQYSILDNFTTADSWFPHIAPVLAGDGNYYGATDAGGHNNLGTLFRITPAGKQLILHSFDATEGIPSSLVVGSDGSVYGNTMRLAFHIGLDGSYTVINKMSFYGPITAASDGNFYFTDLISAYKMDINGVVTHVADGPVNLSGFQGNIVIGGDNKLYAVAQYAGPGNDGAIVSASPGGRFIGVYNFTGGQDGSRPSALVAGADGNIYGVSGGNAASNGAVFRFNVTSGHLAILHTFPLAGPNLTETIAVKNDGSVVGIAYSDHTFAYTITSDGSYSEAVPLPDGGSQQYSSLIYLRTEPNGVVAGAWAVGGIHGDGAIFTLPGL